MVNNCDRAEWAGRALKVFADQTMGGHVSDEAICDLICDLGHFAELELGFSGKKVLKLYRTAIGAWSAEREDSVEDPLQNHIVNITIDMGA